MFNPKSSRESSSADHHLTSIMQHYYVFSCCRDEILQYKQTPFCQDAVFILRAKLNLIFNFSTNTGETLNYVVTLSKTLRMFVNPSLDYQSFRG